MGLLYGRAGRLTAENGGFRRGQKTNFKTRNMLVMPIMIGGWNDFELRGNFLRLMASLFLFEWRAVWKVVWEYI
jgi:hypothetical protein